MVEGVLIVIAPVICLARLAGLCLVQRRRAEKLDLGEGHSTSQTIPWIASALGSNPPWLLGRTSPSARMP